MRYTDPSGYFVVPDYNFDYQDLSERGSGGGFSPYNGFVMSVGLSGYRGGNVSFWGQLENSIRGLADGYYDLTDLNSHNGTYTFSWKYNKEGTDFYNQEAEKAIRQKAFNDEMVLAAARNIGYGKSFVNPGGWEDLISGFDNIIREIWYSPIVMKVIPDLITLSFDPSCTVGLGLGVSFQLNILTRGLEPGVFVTNVITDRTLFMGDFSLNIGAATYNGNIYTLRRRDLTGTTQDLGVGLLLGVNVWRGLNNNGDAMWYGWKSGFGGTLGISYGTGNTNTGWRPDIFSLGHKCCIA